MHVEKSAFQWPPCASQTAHQETEIFLLTALCSQGWPRASTVSHWLCGPHQLVGLTQWDPSSSNGSQCSLWTLWAKCDEQKKISPETHHPLWVPPSPHLSFLLLPIIDHYLFSSVWKSAITVFLFIFFKCKRISERLQSPSCEKIRPHWL